MLDCFFNLLSNGEHLAQIKAGNNMCKLKIEIRQILYVFYQLNKTTKKLYTTI